MSASVLCFDQVWKTYQMGPVRVDALKSMSFTILQGELILIVGPSGSGKSTLLHLLGGLDRATQGTIQIEGKTISHLPTRRLAQIRNSKIGFVFQRFNLLPKFTAVENVEVPMLYAGKHKRWRRNRAMELLDLVNLSDRAKHRPNELSGGQQQRVAIARALANDPLFLLADEPTGNLDTSSGEEIIHLFLHLNKMGKTILVVTHDLELIRIATRVLYIRDGAIESEERRDGNHH